METTKGATAVALHGRARIAVDLLWFVGVSLAAGLITSCAVAAVVILISGPGA
ncbi:MAG: hypothetical protein ACXW2I_14405 [Burkholderiales bacterium]